MLNTQSGYRKGHSGMTLRQRNIVSYKFQKFNWNAIMTSKTITSHILQNFTYSLCVVGCIVKESGSLCAGSLFINDVNSSLLLLVLPVSFADEVQ